MLDYLLTLSPVEFEHAIAQLLPHLGFGDVRRVGGANDRGIDIVCRDADGSLVVGQCKRYDPSRRVGALAVQHLSAMAFQRRAHRGIFVTTAAYTASARRQADEFDIELIDGLRLVKLLRQHGLDEGIENRGLKSGPRSAPLFERCLRDPHELGLVTPLRWGIWESDRIEGPGRPLTRARPKGRWHPMLYDEVGTASRVLNYLGQVTPEEFRQAIAIRRVFARRETETAELHGKTVALRSIKRSEIEIESFTISLPVAPNNPVQDFIFEQRVDVPCAKKSTAATGWRRGSSCRRRISTRSAQTTAARWPRLRCTTTRPRTSLGARCRGASLDREWCLGTRNRSHTTCSPRSAGISARLRDSRRCPDQRT
jgi:hypothetical protein